MEKDKLTRILFIDDKDENRSSVQLQMTLLGYYVNTLSWLDDAEAEIGSKNFREKFDVVITDLDLGTGDEGLSVAQAVKKVAPDMPIFLWSATSDILNEDQRKLFTGILKGKGTIGFQQEMDAAIKGLKDRPSTPGGGLSGPKKGNFAPNL